MVLFYQALNASGIPSPLTTLVLLDREGVAIEFSMCKYLLGKYT